jgi:D-lactate dehydrogenase
MKIAFFDTHGFEKAFFSTHSDHQIHFFETRLTPATAALADGFSCVCAFVNDQLNEAVLDKLKQGGTTLIALRSAGFNHVDLAAAKRLGMTVVRVPEYSPHAVAEHAVALIMTLNRKIHRAYARVREGNFSLNGLMGFDLNKKVVGVVGTGRIGKVFAQIMLGFGCRVLAYDRQIDSDLEKQGVIYVDLTSLFRESDIISLHVPLNKQTHHLVNDGALALTKPGVMLINTSRGGLIDTASLIRYLKNGHVGTAGLDVYEEEEGVFFENLSETVLQDDQLARLLTFPNVILTSHQAFLTIEALQAIATTTIQNIDDFIGGRPLSNEVKA